MSLQGTCRGWPPPRRAGCAGRLALALWFLAGNLALQYGAARLPANVTAVVMITEVLFASGSAVLLGAGVRITPLLLGGALIVGGLAAGRRATPRLDSGGALAPEAAHGGTPCVRPAAPKPRQAASASSSGLAR